MVAWSVVESAENSAEKLDFEWADKPVVRMADKAVTMGPGILVCLMN